MPTAVKKFQCARRSGCYAAHVTGSIDIANAEATSCVVLTVCHAGRDYPDGIESRLALPMARIRQLEDAYADLLVDRARAEGYTTLVARTPRLLIDLNRDETDFTPHSFPGARGVLARPSHRARGGLGLVPERLGHERIWRAPMSAGELARRIAGTHRPWHAAIDAALARARARHGRAVLIDVHSMPALPGSDAPQIVVGTRHGISATPRTAETAAAVFRDAKLRTAMDAPYSGAHMIERHGRPRHGVDAIQIEIDRRLYLDAALEAPGEGLDRIRRLVAQLAARLGQSSGVTDWLQAAE